MKKKIVQIFFGVSLLMLPLLSDGAAPTGALSQLADPNGCIKESGDGSTCVDGSELANASSVAVSPDSKHVYVTSAASDAVRVFSRNAVTGALTEASCINEDASDGCADGQGLEGAAGIALSPDGRHAYVASLGSDAVTAFSRNKLTGALTQVPGVGGCISETGNDITCADGRGLDGAQGIAVSQDGKHVYVASFESNAIAVFSRNKTTGALTQVGCINEAGNDGCDLGRGLDRAFSVALTRDGKNVYVASNDSNAVAVFSRNKTTGALTQLALTDGCINEDNSDGCADGRGLQGAASVTVSPDGKNVYVASVDSNAVAIFSRNTTTGALIETDCINEDNSDGCADGRGLNGARGVIVSAKGKNVYVASYVSNAVAVFSRNKTTGALTQLAGEDGCINEVGDDGCADGKGLNGALAVAVSQNNKNVYVASWISSGVAIFATH